MHKLGSRLVLFFFFPQVLVVYLAEITFPQSNCISLPLHASYIYILYISLHTHTYIKYVCVYVRVYIQFSMLKFSIEL